MQLHFQQEHYDKALKSFVDAFRLHPNGPLSIRLGIAACHFKLHNYQVSEAAYARVLQLDPDNAEALSGLAAVSFVAADPAIGVPTGLAHLQRAYAVDPTSAPVLNALSAFALVRGDYTTSIELAESAVRSRHCSQVSVNQTAQRECVAKWLRGATRGYAGLRVIQLSGGQLARDWAVACLSRLRHLRIGAEHAPPSPVLLSLRP